MVLSWVHAQEFSVGEFQESAVGNTTHGRISKRPTQVIAQGDTKVSLERDVVGGLVNTSELFESIVRVRNSSNSHKKIPPTKIL